MPCSCHTVTYYLALLTYLTFFALVSTSMGIFADKHANIRGNRIGTVSTKLCRTFQLLLAIFSLTLGLEIRGEIIRGYPCIRRLNHLYCPTPGNNYPKEKIEEFIDENKALIRRMFGEYNYSPADNYTPPFQGQYETYDGYTLHTRSKRATNSRNSYSTSTNKVDVCESAVEIVTPYWASNSAGKIRAIVNTQHLQQAIQQEVCQSRSGQTKRCTGDCSCEQKYKWHRLLAYDPDDECKGIFMDWFLFPSCCVCRCSLPTSK
ncbi:protein spaetzle 3-like isoform X1 [Tachypleus tridentatus]|uniref:protein spaetzle 3-like isoform X1 n=1 Tax=Tachypleus tridentatus TaxID=6853 RepID=UPI003FD10983